MKKAILLELNALKHMSYDLKYEFFELLKQLKVFSWELIVYLFEIITLPFCAWYRLKIDENRKL